MKYRIALQESEEGFSACALALPGCWSQGKTKEEALDNIADAIREYLSVREEEFSGTEISEIEVGE